MGPQSPGIFANPIQGIDGFNVPAFRKKRNADGKASRREEIGMKMCASAQ
jgi:hypothetical protein